MPSTRRSRLTAVCTLLTVALLTCVAYGLRLVEPRTRTFTGTLVEVDLENHSATLAFPHPKTKEITKVTGEIHSECEVFVNGKKLTSPSDDALHKGVEVEVEVEIHPIGRRVVVLKATILTPSPQSAQEAI